MWNKNINTGNGIIPFDKKNCYFIFIQCFLMEFHGIIYISIKMKIKHRIKNINLELEYSINFSTKKWKSTSIFYLNSIFQIF